MDRKMLVSSVSFTLDELKTLKNVCTYLVPIISHGNGDYSEDGKVFNKTLENLVELMLDGVGTECLDFLREIRDLEFV